jgi:hypothetical protein
MLNKTGIRKSQIVILFLYTKNLITFITEDGFLFLSSSQISKPQSFLPIT